MSQSPKKNKNDSFGLKRFLALANDYVNPDTSNFEGLEKYLQIWLCEKLNTVPWDNRIQDATLEDMLFFFYVEKVKNDPSVVNELYLDGTPEESYEDWLKKEMGEDYLDDAEFGETQAQLKEEQMKAIKDRNLPDKIRTDFSNLDGIDE